MKKIIVSGLLLAFFHFGFAQIDSIVSIHNHRIRLEYNLKKGTYSIYALDKNLCFFSGGILKIETSFSQLSSNYSSYNRRAEIVKKEDNTGKSKMLSVVSSSPDRPDLIQKFVLYDKSDFIVLDAGLKNNFHYDIRIMAIHPAIGLGFPDLSSIDDLCFLDGNGGGNSTEVIRGKALKCRNNILATFKSGAVRYSIVAGGVTYHEFEKFAEIIKKDKGFKVDVWNHDDYGKLVKPHEIYIPDDRMALCFSEPDPFTAMENYGLVLKNLQNVKLNHYDFPSVCLWYASHKDYGAGEKLNSSSGAVKEMQHIKNSGFLNYSRAAVRLVPDNYERNNQQGWWDDEHWQKIPNDACCAEGPCYDKPYETSEKWAKAVIKLGGIPLTYFQTAARSEDFCDAYPNYMLYNNPAIGKILDNKNISEICPYLSYDFTDSGFVSHMEAVYKNLKNAGIKGLMFDYPFSGWSKGGYDDPYVTAASVYRKIFSLAYNGLDTENFVDERNCQIPFDKGSDITLGVVASQRTMGDNDVITPQSVSISGLRWYKNRVVVSYDADAKNPFKAIPGNTDAKRAMYTMSYVATSRLLLGVSFAKLTKDDIYDLSRTFPYHTTPQSARPIDAFITPHYPAIYDFKVNEKWHQLTLFNYKIKSGDWPSSWEICHKGKKVEMISQNFSVSLSDQNVDGGLALNPGKDYYFYDFWNDQLIGRLKGDQKLEQVLRPGEARMISIHETEPNPQFLSTNRHIMQGMIDLLKCEWNPDKYELTGTSDVVGKEAYIIKVATNGFNPVSVKASKGKIRFKQNKGNPEILDIIIESQENTRINWVLTFLK